MGLLTECSSKSRSQERESIIFENLMIIGMVCNQLENPLGIGYLPPLLGWKLSPQEKGLWCYQSAYQIQVASSKEYLSANEPDLWDSGKIISEKSTLIPYEGTSLCSRQRCFWRVRVWDQHDNCSPFSLSSFWETGLLHSEDWEGEWIGGPPSKGGLALYFRHVFNIKKPILRARAYLAGLGYHELHLNGKKVGDHVLEPGWTDYDKRVFYVTHDAAPFLQIGYNAIGVIVGNGWLGMPKLLLQLEVFYEDGSIETLATHGGHTHAPDVWHVGTGPVRGNSIYDGETYDARLEMSGWDIPNLDNDTFPSHFSVAMPIESPRGKLCSQELEPIRVVGTHAPKDIREIHPGIFVVDAGQNLAGWVRIRLRAKAGTCIQLRYAENLREDGSINQDNLRTAMATDTYYAKGGDKEEWEPRFTYHGFRYVQIEGWPGQLHPDSLDIRTVRSDLKPVGTFQCGYPLLNAIQKIVFNTEASNLHSVPTDCPQRDERLGWLNDMTVRTEELLYHFQAGQFLAKWVDDIADIQNSNGSITDTAPFKWGKRPADPVSVSYLLSAWLCHLHYGDFRILETHYDGFQRWVAYLEAQTEEGILRYSSWGDWAPPEAFADSESIGAGAVSRETPGELISTGYLYYHHILMAKIANVLEKRADATYYEHRAKEVAAAFHRAFWKESVGGYGSNNQSCNALALSFHLVPAENIPRVVDNLVRNVENHGNHLTTGNLCSKYLLEALSEHGRIDVAFRIATQTTYPSWGYMLENGATTLWERWEYSVGGAMHSHNHPMLGSVASWMFKYLAGILPDEQHPGFRRFIIHPRIVSKLGWVEATYHTQNGVISSGWSSQSDRLEIRLKVPSNCCAKIIMPDGTPSIDVGPGEHSFTTANPVSYIA